MVSYFDKSRRKVSIGIFEAFTGEGRTIRRRKRTSNQAGDAKTTAAPVSAATAAPVAAPLSIPPVALPAAAPVGPGPPPWLPFPTTSPEALPPAPLATEPAAEPAPAPANPAEAAPAPAPAPDPVHPPAALTSLEWSKEEDEKLLDLKKQNKTWKEIVTAFEGKFLRDQLRDRFKELHKEKHSDSGKKDDNKSEAPKKDGAQGKKPADGAPNANGNKPVEATNSERTRLVKDLPPIQFLDGEELSTGQMVNLYRLHEQYEVQKWINIISRIFDQTGRRIDPRQLRDKLGDSVWLEGDAA